MRNYLIFIAFVVLSGCVSNTSSGTDAKLETAELSALITGKSVKTVKGQRFNYKSNGDYLHEWPSGTASGTWQIKGKQICINFDGGGTRCDSYSQKNGTYYRFNQDGKSWRVLSIKPYQ